MITVSISIEIVNFFVFTILFNKFTRFLFFKIIFRKLIKIFQIF